MTIESKVKLLSSAKFQIRSSKQAFLASKITEAWQSRDELFKAVAGVFTRKEFDSAIDDFIESGAVELNENKKKKLQYNNGQLFRDYTQICFNRTELAEAPELPENLKKEMLFLYYYGKNIDYYRILNLNFNDNPSVDELLEKCRYYRSLFAGRNFEDVNMFGYRKKLERIRKLINDACQITEPEEKEKYDVLLLPETQQQQQQEPTKQIKTSSQTAEEHFMIAMGLNNDGDYKQAYNELLIAIHMDPDNKEYLSFKKELKVMVNRKRSDDLFETFEKDEFVLLDEKKLEGLIDSILELNDGSAQSHLKLAKIAIEKGMPEMALEHSYQAVKKNRDLKPEVEGIVRFAKKRIQQLSDDRMEPKTFEINKNNVLRKK